MVVDQSEGSLLSSGTDSRLVDRFSASKEYALKARKPYTITKQRERWTQEEHIKFLEALKLYGRSWRQIEEHVGNKTAVQIRSHAQKFFSKVVREPSGADGTEVGTIDIPPPRAKRKPTHPYPRNVSSQLKKRADPMRLTSHDTSSSNHESTSPSSPESPSTQSLKLFGKTVYVTGSRRPLSVDTITSLPCNSMPTLEPEFQATGGLSVYGDLVFCTTRPRDGIEPMIKRCSQDGKNGEFGNKGDRYARGFVPYKRCVTEESSVLTGEEREELRVRLCL